MFERSILQVLSEYSVSNMLSGLVDKVYMYRQLITYYKVTTSMGTGSIGTNPPPYGGHNCSKEGCKKEPVPGGSYCTEHGGLP